MTRPRTLDRTAALPIEELVPGPEPELLRGPEGRLLTVSDTRLDGNELAYLTECVRSNWISSQGPFVARFEDAFAAAVGCRFGVSCASGTAALHLAVAALGIGAGDEVLLPTFTMIATANAVTYTGAKPVLLESDRATWNLDVAAIEAKVTPRTRAIIVVHTYGRPVDMEPVRAIARRHGFAVIEDAAEAHGAAYAGRPVGSLGDAAVFSFYGNKIVSTGEGGMVTTNDAEIARLARRLRGHAFSEERHFWHEHLGFGYRMTNLQAAVGLAQTERLDELVGARRENARRYAAALAGIDGLVLPAEQPGTKNVFWMYGLLVDEDFGCSRDELRGRLARAGIETRTFFVPIHLQPIYREAHLGERYPVAEDLCRKGLYLPSGHGLTERDIDHVATEVRRARGTGRALARAAGR
jgi:perosamine synthetase